MDHCCLCATAPGILQSPLSASGCVPLFAFDASPQVFLRSLVLTLDTNSTTYRPWLPPSLPAWPFLCLGSPEQSPFILWSVYHQKGHVLEHWVPLLSELKMAVLLNLIFICPSPSSPSQRHVLGFKAKQVKFILGFGKKEIIKPRMQRGASELGMGLVSSGRARVLSISQSPWAILALSPFCEALGPRIIDIEDVISSIPCSFRENTLAPPWAGSWLWINQQWPEARLASRNMAMLGSPVCMSGILLSWIKSSRMPETLFMPALTHSGDYLTA